MKRRVIDLWWALIYGPLLDWRGRRQQRHDDCWRHWRAPHANPWGDGDFSMLAVVLSSGDPGDHTRWIRDLTVGAPSRDVLDWWLDVAASWVGRELPDDPTFADWCPERAVEVLTEVRDRLRVLDAFDNPKGGAA